MTYSSTPCFDHFPERILERPGSSRSDFQRGDIIYLQDNSVCLNFDNGRKLNIYRAPSTQQFGNWAFQHLSIRDVWKGVVPTDADILLTHGPPKWHLDANALGDEYLLRELSRLKPKLIVFGHIHAGYGREVVTFDQVGNAFEDIVFGKKGAWSLMKMAFYLLVTKSLRRG
jgi:Calcineurin-like phosphoesterase